MKMKFTKLTLMALGMLVFSMSLSAQNLECIITLPSGVISVPVGAPASDFGGLLTAGQEVTGVAVPVEADTSAPDPADDTPEMGCDTIVNGEVVMGNVALVQRGACFFSDKVYRAQQAGAISAIICNHTEGAGVIGMASGGDFGGLATIPSGFISFEDCALITAAIENGDEVSITLRVPSLFDGISAFAKQTPIAQVLPLDSMAISFTNAGSEAITDGSFTLDITDPNGVLTTFSSGGEIPAETTVVASFDQYVPIDMGRYEVVFSNNITADTIFDFFEITEHTWALDDGSFAATAAVSDADFAANDFRYDMGSYYVAGEVGATIEYGGFALGNAADVVAGNGGSNTFTFLLYDVPEAVLINGSTSYDDFDLLSFGFFIIDGTETQDQMLIAPFDSPVVLDAKQDVLMVVSYAGQEGISPRFTTGGATSYPILGTTVFTNQLFLGGFIGSPSGAVRLYEQGFEGPSSTTNTYLNKDEVTLSPNPVASELVVAFDLAVQANEVEVSVVNLQGQVVMTRLYENVAKANYNVDVTNLPNGSYVLLVTTPEGRSADQFIVTK